MSSSGQRIGLGVGRAWCRSSTAPASWRTPNASRVQRRRAGSRQRMECGGWRPLSELGRRELGPSCGLRSPQVEAEALCARAGGGLLCAVKRWARSVVYCGSARRRRRDRRAQRREGGLRCGTVGASCGEDPGLFQGTRQFWDPAGKEALLGWATFWRNERPRAVSAQPSRPVRSKR